MKNPLRYIPLFLLNFICLSAFAQLQVQAKSDKQKIFIGDQFRLSVSVTGDRNSLPGFPIADSLPGFELIEQGKIDTSFQGGLVLLNQELVLTSFDSGRQVLPPFHLQVGDRIYRSDSIPIEVTYSPNGVPQEYHDIKDIQEVKGDINWLYWIAGVASLLALIIIFFWWRKNRNKHPAIKRYEHLSPYEEAMKLLDDLEAEEMPVKERYTRLTYIFRIYLKRKFGWNAFGKTTYDLLLEVEKTPLPEDDYKLLAQTLRICNLVKFAKYEPAQDEHRTHIGSIRHIVKSLNNQP